MHASFVTLALALAVSAGPLRRQNNDFALKNGQDALALVERFKAFTAGGDCNAATDANVCIGDQFAQCANGKFVAQPCGPGTVCRPLPLVNSPGTSVTCTTEADFTARIAATGATAPATGNQGNGQNQGGNGQGNGNNNAGNGGAAGNGGNNGNGNGGGDPQTSLTLDPKVIAKGFAQDGQAQPTEGQVASLTSVNNFINFCLTVDLPITDGKQVPGGSCNPAIIGVIPSVDRMPSSKFVNPPNGATIPANQQFTIQMAVKNLITGNFVNAQTNYFAAPQQLVGGVIKGHTHVVIEKLAALDAKDPLDSSKFQFFKGVNGAAQNGIVSADVAVGVPAGAYRLCSINTSANHAPVIGPVAQHGSFDDCIYFTAT